VDFLRGVLRGSLRQRRRDTTPGPAPGDRAGAHVASAARRWPRDARRAVARTCRKALPPQHRSHWAAIAKESSPNLSAQAQARLIHELNAVLGRQDFYSSRYVSRMASSSTATLLTPANVSTTRHAKMRREKFVDHGVYIGACPVQQADDRGVDVPHLVRCRRAQPHLRLGWVHPEPRASPAVLPDEAVPGRGRRRHRAEPLREDRERAGWDVTVFGCGDHIPDHLDLGERQPMR
jgi:hypothetical protein